MELITWGGGQIINKAKCVRNTSSETKYSVHCRTEAEEDIFGLGG